MKQATKLWLLLASVFVFVLSATLVSCEKEKLEVDSSFMIETPQQPSTTVDWRCCDDPETDDSLNNGITKNDKTEMD